MSTANKGDGLCWRVRWSHGAHTKPLYSLFHVLHLTFHVVLLCSEKLDFIQQFTEVLLTNFGLFALHYGYLNTQRNLLRWNMHSHTFPLLCGWQCRSVHFGLNTYWVDCQKFAQTFMV